ncbi:MAG TPA: 30S ribosomal protein S13 [Candidatus Avipropionibacterium avicola]|uniref:30S ribosomal protein S13 n=1 Tax=Candidatus Avipropionibacterium avicola TaxID=2840701 RepID=A0A9D1H0Q5_9ACTN|nr:30S ribosomal protein S13 [Candidatus Avipropionibacterium avicola]
MSLPAVSEQQLEAARARAAAARKERAEVKQALRTGRTTLAEVLDRRDDEVIAQLKVVDLLKCLPRVGNKRALAVMERVDIADNRRLRGLGRHQIARLKEEFSGV